MHDADDVHSLRARLIERDLLSDGSVPPEELARGRLAEDDRGSTRRGVFRDEEASAHERNSHRREVRARNPVHLGLDRAIGADASEGANSEHVACTRGRTERNPTSRRS